MQIEIHKDRKLAELQNDFSLLFPFLKIAFFSDNHGKGKGSAKTDALDPETTVADCSATGSEGNLQLSADMTVAELEQTIYRDFGLAAQVFRKTGHHTWLETTATDFWTLQRQNQQGKEMMELNRELKPAEEIDYD